MRVGEQLEQAVDEALRAGYARLRGMHGYGSQVHQAHATDATHPTHPTHRIEGAGRAEWAFTSKCTGESWQRIKIPGPWSGCCFQPRKNWTEPSPTDVLPHW